MGLLGSLTGANAAKKAAAATENASKRYNRTMNRLATPSLEAGRKGLSLLRGYSTYLQNQLGRESPYVRGQHEASIRGINRSRRTNLAESDRFFRATGNPALGRGERFRINMAADEAESNANLNFGMAQEAYRTDSENRYYNSIGSLVNAGNTGIELAAGGAKGVMQGQMEAANMNAQASMMNSGFLMNLVGMYLTSPKGPLG